MFSRVDEYGARQATHAWIDGEMLEPPQTPRTHARVDAVLDRALASGEIYRLDVPEGEDLMHMSTASWSARPAIRSTSRSIGRRRPCTCWSRRTTSQGSRLPAPRVDRLRLRS